MSYVLDAPIRAGAVTVAALSRIDLVPAKMERGVSVWSQKRPVAIFVQDSNGLRVFSLDGAELATEAVETLSPGVIARFIQLAQS